MPWRSCRGGILRRRCSWSGAVPSRSRRCARPRKASADDVVFTGYQPARDIAAYVAAADVLASPRIAGTNTPLKIYSYLRAARPIVATDLLTHTQVLTRETSLLVPPQPEAFAGAIERLLDDPALADRLAQAAAELARSRYSREEYVARTVRACERLVQAGAARA